MALSWENEVIKIRRAHGDPIPYQKPPRTPPKCATCDLHQHHESKDDCVQALKREAAHWRTKAERSKFLQREASRTLLYVKAHDPQIYEKGKVAALVCNLKPMVLRGVQEAVSDMLEQGYSRSIKA